MELLKIEETKKIQLNILRLVSEFCQKNNLSYFLCAGTMLGAVRHKGFIPWDDDIDIMMPREDYEKLIENFKIPNLELYHQKYYPKYGYPFLKIGDKRTFLKEDYIVYNNPIGISIDVFPIDGFPNSKDERERHIRKLGFYKKLIFWKLYALSTKMDFYKKIIFEIIRKIIPIKYVLHKMDKTAKKHSLKNSNEFAGLAVWGYGKKEICPRWIYNETAEFNFEGFRFKGLKNYDIYLKSLYGDYMQLPPKEERVPKHHYECGIKKEFSLKDILDELNEKVI